MDDRFITRCPVGCEPALEPTRVRMPEGALMRCPACGQHVSQATAARYDASMREFDTRAGTDPVAGARARRDEVARRRILRLARLTGRAPVSLDLLDVGCSSGVFLSAAITLGVRARGVEPAPQAAASARARGLDVRTATLGDSGYGPAEFDAVTLFEVIEHLADPLGLARQVHHVLRPGGVWLIGTANIRSWTFAAMGARWNYLDIDSHGGHVSFFTPDSIRALAARTGFEVAAIDTRGLRWAERGDVPAPLYRIAKIATEALSPLAAWAGRGQDMLAWLRRPAT